MNKLFIFVLLFAAIGVKSQNKIYDTLHLRYAADQYTCAKLETFFNSSTEQKIHNDSINAQRFIDSALTFIHVPYCYGGASRKCTDCSGFVYQVFKSVKINMPHSSNDLAHYGIIITNKDSLKAGDLVFFIKTYKTSNLITHSGIYIGDGKFIHASHHGGVNVSELNEKYYAEKFIFGTRVF